MAFRAPTTNPEKKPSVSNELRQRVIDLHHRHTLSDVALMTDLPLGTVKTLCSRSGAFRDNASHRALFSLPPMQPSTATQLELPELPPQVAVTGDAEVDAMLWLRQVINTGQAAWIDKAMTAAQRIASPHEELEKRYRKYLSSVKPGNDLVIALGSFGFADLEALTRQVLKRESLRAEARARFGEALFDATEAERFCLRTLAGLEPTDSPLQDFDSAAVTARFQAHAELLPHTLSDCLHELTYWDSLYQLREATKRDSGDYYLETQARKQFVFGLLAQRRKRTRVEGLAVFRYLAEGGHMTETDTETEAILQNLIGPG